ncbi:MAG: hypothetical protein IJX74_04055 [Clostridia bacterium]|nr:hypothetical protein [Clostridia bacterium]
MNNARQRRIIKITGIILFITLVASVVYSLVRFFIAPSELAEGEPYEKVRSDYLLMLVQCLLGVLVMMLPSFFERRLKVVVPNVMVIMYFAFLYCAIYLGEIHNFYYVIPYWDTVLHAFSGGMLGALGFIFVDILNKDKKVRVSLTPFFIAVFAFSFALAVGALWEIYEFSFDALLGLNLQKHSTETGVALVGTEALRDTMSDIIVDAISALVVVVVGYFTEKKNRRESSAVDLMEKNKYSEDRGTVGSREAS